MKSDNVQRGVRARRGGSAGGSAGLGKVGRMQGVGTVVDAGSRSRENRVQQARLITKGWTVAVALLALGLVSGAFAWWVISRGSGAGEVAGSGPRMTMLPEVPEVVLTRPHPDVLEEIAERALAVASVEDVLAVIHPCDVGPQEVLAYMQGVPGNDGVVEKISVTQEPDVNGLMVQNAVVMFSDQDGKMRNRLIMLTPGEDGVWRMDFPAFARLAEPSWKDFQTGKADSIVARVYVEKDYYFNGMFADERRWASYAMASPDEEELMIGYCLVGSSTDQALQAILMGSPRAMRATVEIRRVDGAGARQYAIQRVVAQDWVVREPEWEERYR